jgi:hypothetical protein
MVKKIAPLPTCGVPKNAQERTDTCRQLKILTVYGSKDTPFRNFESELKINYFSEKFKFNVQICL